MLMDNKINNYENFYKYDFYILRLINKNCNLNKEKILENLSAILKVPMKKIGLKATTSEKIGIIGNNEAISVQSIVNLKDLL